MLLSHVFFYFCFDPTIQGLFLYPWLFLNTAGIFCFLSFFFISRGGSPVLLRRNFSISALNQCGGSL
jgi:hypothetical protein